MKVNAPGVNAPVAPTPAPRLARRLITLTVRRTEQLTPHMVRVVAGGDELSSFVANEFTDAYVKLVFPRPGTYESGPLDWAVASKLRQEQRPLVRTYTVRSRDQAAGTITIDFVVHGDEGVAGPWAARARPGDPLRLLGPGGAYAPRSDVDWHLLIGDEAALPAIAATLEAMQPGALALVLVEVANGADELALTTPATADIRWLHRDDDTTPTLLDAARALSLPPGTGQGFVHGELRMIRALRPHFLAEDRFAAELLSISGYWSHGQTEEGFQAEKAAGGA